MYQVMSHSVYLATQNSMLLKLNYNDRVWTRKNGFKKCTNSHSVDLAIQNVNYVVMATLMPAKM